MFSSLYNYLANLPKNIGLQAKILSTRTFTIFVIMALLTTFATTPLVTFLYPPWYQKKLAAWKRGEIEWDSDPATHDDSVGSTTSKDLPPHSRVGQLLVYLRLDNMPGLLNLVSLFGKEATPGSPNVDDKSQNVVSEKAAARPPIKAVRAHGLRLIQLGDRDSSVMTVSEVDEYTKNDPVVNTWCIVGQILKVGVSGEVATMPESRFAEALLTKSSDISSDLLLLPWSGTGTLGDSTQQFSDSKLAPSYVNFTKTILASNQHNVAVFFPKGSLTREAGPSSVRTKLQRAYSFSDIHREINPLPVKSHAHRIIMPYFGGEDDKFALMLVLQLCEKQEATATVFHIYGDSGSSDERDYLGRVSSSLPAAIASRVEFNFMPANDTAEEVMTSTSSAIRNDSADLAWNNLIVVGRRGAAGKLSGGKIRLGASEELVDCLGDSAGLLIESGIKADLLIVQAKPGRS